MSQINQNPVRPGSADTDVAAGPVRPSSTGATLESELDQSGKSYTTYDSEELYSRPTTSYPTGSDNLIRKYLRRGKWITAMATLVLLLAAGTFMYQILTGGSDQNVTPQEGNNIVNNQVDNSVSMNYKLKVNGQLEVKEQALLNTLKVTGASVFDGLITAKAIESTEISVNGQVVVTGDLQATNLLGNGSGLSNVDAVTFDGLPVSYFLSLIEDAAASPPANQDAALRSAENNFSAVNTFGANTIFSNGMTVQGNLSGSSAVFSTSISALQFTQDGNVVCDMSGNCAGVGAGVTTAGGTIGTIALFTGTQAIGNSIISQSAGTVTVAGTLAATALQGNGASLTSINGSSIASGTIGVSVGGTGRGNFVSNGVVYGNGTGVLQVTAAGTTGECLVGTTSAAPSWSSCSLAATGANPGGTATGDLSGSYPNPTVSGLSGVPLSIGSLTNGDLLAYDGTYWAKLSGNSYISNQSTNPQLANFYIRSLSTGSVGAVIEGAVGQTADILQLGVAGNSTPLISVGSNGVIGFSSGSGAVDATISRNSNAIGISNLVVAGQVGLGGASRTTGVSLNVRALNNAGTAIVASSNGASQTGDLFQTRSIYGTVYSGFTANGAYAASGTNTVLSNLAVPAISTVSTGTNFYYVVSAWNAQGETLPSPPVGMANNSSTISWPAVAGATGYKIFRSTSLTFGASSILANPTQSNWIGCNNGGTCSYTDTGSSTGAGTPLNSTTGSGLIVQGWAGQTTDIFQAQDSSGTSVARIAANGSVALDGALNVTGASTLSGGINIGNSSFTSGGSLTLGALAATSGTTSVDSNSLSFSGNYYSAGISNPATFTIQNDVSSSSNQELVITTPTGNNALNITRNGKVGLGGSSAPMGTLTVKTVNTNTITQVLQAISSQTSDLMQILNNGGTVLSGFNTSGQFYNQSGSYSGTLVQGSLTAARTYTLPDESGTICVQSSSNCGFASTVGSGSYIQNQGAGAQSGSQFWISGNGRATSFRASSSVVAPLLDTETAATLSLGTTNANAVSISKAGVTTTVNGGLTVLQAASFNGGISVSSNLTVTGGSNVAFQKGSDFTTTGILNDVNFGSGSVFRLTGSSQLSINGITGGTNGRMITLVNDSSTWVSIRHDNTGSAAGNRIHTGSFIDTFIPVGAAMTLIYDDGASMWRIVGSSVNTSLTNLNNVAVNVAFNPNADNIRDLGSSGTSWRTLYADTSVLTPTVDTASATALNLGTGTASAVNISRIGVTTAINGALTVNEAGLFYGGASVTSGGGVAFTVQGASAQNIVEFKNNGGTSVAGINQHGQFSAIGGIFTNSTQISNVLTDLTITNANTSATVSVVNATRISLIGVNNANANSNVSNGINFSNVTARTNNTFNGLYFGTGYDSLLNYNGIMLITGQGKLLNAGLSSAVNYSNLQNVTNLTASGQLTVGTNASGQINLGDGYFTKYNGSGFDFSSALNAQGGLSTGSGGGTAQRIDASGNLVNINNATITGTLSVAGLTTLSGGLTIGASSNVSFLRNTTNITATGNLDNINIGNGSVFKFAGASTQYVRGIAGGSDGRVITIINDSASLLQIMNESTGSTAANRIITGVGSFINVTVGASLMLIYDSDDSRWRILSTSAGANQLLSNLTGTTYVNTDLTPNANNTHDLGFSYNSWRTLYANTSVLSPRVDTATSVALNLGTSSASSITVGQTGVTTNIQGNTQVTLSATAGSTAVCQNASGHLAVCSGGGGGGVTTVGALDGGTYSANGASISGSTVYLQAATATHVGLVTTGTQSFAGMKTFDDGVAAWDGLWTSALYADYIDSAGSGVIEIGQAMTGDAFAIDMNLDTTFRGFASFVNGIDAAQSGALDIGYTIGGYATSINLNQNTSIVGTLTVSGAISAASLSVSGPVVLTSTLTATSATFAGTLTVNGHIITGNTSGSTTVAVGVGGTCGGGSSATITGNDTAGKISITAGTGCSGAGPIAQVTFANAYGASPVVVITPTNANAAGSDYFLGDASTTGFRIDHSLDTSDSMVYTYTYHVMQ